MSKRRPIRPRLREAARRAVAVQRRSSSIRGANLAAAISMRAFLALFPIALLVIGTIGLVGGNPSRTARDIAEAVGLGKEFGRTLGHSVQTAEGRKVLSSLVGIAGLIWTGTGLAGAMGSAWDAAWDRRGGSLRSRTLGVPWLLGGLAFLAATVLTSALLHDADILIELGTIGGCLADGLFLFWTALLLPERKLPWRAMVRPAVYGGIALEILRVLGATIVPALVRRSSTAYGAIGATFALLVWLLVMGRVVVYVAIYERLRWEQRTPVDPISPAPEIGSSLVTD
ncbi:MAG: YihY/virulence factor BrkB family protein [Acidimicrobiia bacterium]